MSSTEFYSQIYTINPSLSAFAYNLTKNSEDALDLMQETKFRAIHNKEKFRAGTNFKAWMFTIMKNIFINGYRKKMKANTIIDSTDNLYYLNSSKNSTTNEGDRNLFIEELNSMIDALEDSIRIPFVMHYEGYKYQEIAEHFNLPLGTVKSRIFFARRALKSQLQKKYGDLYATRLKKTG